MNYVKVLQFDTDSPEFIRGVEVGRIWERLKNEDEEVLVMIHATNAEMIMRISEATDRPVISEEHDDRWMTVTFAAKERA